MVRSMSRRIGTGRNSKRAFRDGPIYIRRWKARRRAERLVERVGRRTLGLVGALVLVLPVAVPLIWINWPSLSKCALIVDVLRCVGGMVALLVPCVVLLIPIRFLTRIPMCPIPGFPSEMKVKRDTVPVFQSSSTPSVSGG